MFRIARLLTTLLALTLFAANSASAITAASTEKPASALFGALEHRVGVDPLASAGRVDEKLSQLYDFASDFSVAARGLTKATDLIPTHGVTQSRRAFEGLKQSIARDGIREPIKYVEANGQRYVVDGHHRLRAARELGIDQVPVQQVELPYGGYKTVDDLFNWSR